MNLNSSANWVLDSGARLLGYFHNLLAAKAILCFCIQQSIDKSSTHLRVDTKLKAGLSNSCQLIPMADSKFLHLPGTHLASFVGKERIAKAV
jgi:hypothetical protein